ncbi:MAG: ribonuclease Y [Proteobacteria bacterium]|nr:ribonuclease Y [Pseudomonadota bacterium]
MSGWLTSVAAAVSLGLGAFAGNKWGYRSYEAKIEETIGSVQKETERLKAKAAREATRLEQVAQQKFDQAEQMERDALRHETDARLELEKIRAEAKTLAQDLVDARMKEAEIEIQKQLLERQNAIDKEEKRRMEAVSLNEKRLVKKEELLDKRAEMLDTRDNELKTVEANIKKAVKQTKKRIKQTEEAYDAATKRLEEISGMTCDDAKQMLIDSITNDAKLEAAKLVRQIEADASEEAEKRAKMILSVAMQRFAGDYVVERCVRTINLPSDEVKGRIIGREGRNIRSIEAATGVDLIVDDTPETVVISAFDPIRREVAAQTLKRLIADGRIHPGRIEETVAKVKQEIEERIREAGDQAFFELGIQNVDPEIITMVGRLKYRTSYGQNIWLHSVEAGWLCGIMAAELDLDIKLARRIGLLHDIGKAMDHEQEGSHALIGAEFLKKHGESQLVCNAVAAHHAEEEPESVYAHLAMAADALSGARPGARREILETYIKRLEDIEKISLSFEGVEKCYAIQAGREIRVLVEPSIIDDEKASVISHDIARRIEQELTYPGRIKVCVIRETRAVETAR